MIVCEKILNLYNSILTNGDIMLSNFHTHTSFCDGENTPEEVLKLGEEFSRLKIGYRGDLKFYESPQVYEVAELLNEQTESPQMVM